MLEENKKFQKKCKGVDRELVVQRFHQETTPLLKKINEIGQLADFLH